MCQDGRNGAAARVNDRVGLGDFRAVREQEAERDGQLQEILDRLPAQDHARQTGRGLREHDLAGVLVLAQVGQHGSRDSRVEDGLVPVEAEDPIAAVVIERASHGVRVDELVKPGQSERVSAPGLQAPLAGSPHQFAARPVTGIFGDEVDLPGQPRVLQRLFRRGSVALPDKEAPAGQTLHLQQASERPGEDGLAGQFRAQMRWSAQVALDEVSEHGTHDLHGSRSRTRSRACGNICSR